MKHLMMTLCLSGMALCGHAQQNLFGAQAPKSPEIHADRSVTFVLMAPDAQQVQLTATFSQPRK
jgi:enterochelin esterase family protein